MRKLTLTLWLAAVALSPGFLHAEAPSAPTGAPEASRPPESGPWMLIGKVIETMDAGIYTYLHVQAGTESVWVASSRLAVAVGDTVSVPDGVRMVDFYSTHLDRRFELIFLVAFVEVEGREKVVPSIPEIHARSSKEGGFEVDLSDISRAEGGQTVGEVFAQRETLSGREVHVRGKVVKVTTGVLGRNWIHVQDGTAGPSGEDDLTVTTAEDVELGEAVVVHGVVRLDSDFGYGYRYELLVEASSVTTD